MSWFQKLCRNTGLMIHGIKQPIKEDAAARGNKQVVKHEVEETKLDHNITLRKTTIEEIEMTPGSDPEKIRQAQQPAESAPESKQPPESTQP